jgi:flagellar biosynthesis anti-sigma factor FlgM
MRIYDSPQHPSAVSGQQTRRTDLASPGKADGASTAAQTRGDEVHLSEAASRFAAGGAEPGSRQERVSRLAALYQQGAYRVDPEAVADSIITDSMQLG